MPAYEPVIGLEVHVQLATRSKIFCTCPTTYGAPPNTQTCPVCLGLPGALPVLNRGAVEFALRLGLACGCTIARRSVFARKNYFYPDLPKGYQISQYERPLCMQGGVTIDLDGTSGRVALTRIHLEEDAGKSLHPPAKEAARWVDLNRAGVPLLEIVSEPSIRSPAEAGAYLSSLRQLVRWLGISDGNMEEGSLRCDANVSLRRNGEATLGTKVEVKNLNSIRGVMDALDHEIERQAAILAAGGRVAQETRSWDPDRAQTVFLRGKESAHDYRYFPEPDLLTLGVDEAWVERVRAKLPELPAARRLRLAEAYGLSDYDARALSESREMADYFEAVVACYGDAKAVSNWMLGEVMRLLNERGEEIASFPVPPGGVAELLQLVAEGTISGRTAKEVFTEMVETGRDAGAIIEAKGLRQIDDSSMLAELVEEILAGHPSQVGAYLAGKEGLATFFVGQVMKRTRGRAHPQLANRLVREALEARRRP